MMNKRGSSILAENLIFIILNIVFISILIAFIFLRMNSASTTEEIYAKQIAMMLDAVEPSTQIVIGMEDAFGMAEKNNYNGKIVDIQGNIVTVRLREKGGYSYPFFNNVDIENSYYPVSAEKTYVFNAEAYK